VEVEGVSYAKWYEPEIEGSSSEDEMWSAGKTSVRCGVVNWGTSLRREPMG